MKIGILGPFINDKSYGGVATFDDGLADGIVKNNQDVVLLSNQNKINHLDCKYYKVNIFNIKKIVNNEKIDVLIGSLFYVRYFPFLKNVKKIYFIHGFFNWKHYSIIKSLLANLFQKFITKSSDIIICNSQFTKMINEEIFNQRIDYVCSLGVSTTYVNECLHNKKSSKEKGTIVYVGRLVDVKNVNKIIESLKYVNTNYKFKIVGDGPELNSLKQIAKENHINVSFYGKLDQKQVFDILKKAEIFVSLNPAEPFGIVFLEALLNNCKIICPSTGGQLDFLKKYSNFVEYVDIYDVVDIARGLRKMLSSPIVDFPIISKEDYYQFTYDKTANEIIRIILNN